MRERQKIQEEKRQSRELERQRAEQAEQQRAQRVQVRKEKALAIQKAREEDREDERQRQLLQAHLDEIRPALSAERIAILGGGPWPKKHLTFELVPTVICRHLQMNRDSQEVVSGPVCVNVVVTLKVSSEGGLHQLRGDDWVGRYSGAPIECPVKLRPWHYLSDKGSGGGGGGRNHYMLKVEYFYFNIFPHSGSITVCGVPNPEAIKVAKKSLADILDINVDEISIGEIVNSTFTGRLVGLYKGESESRETVDFIASVLCSRNVAQKHWLQVEAITDSFPAIKLRSTTREEELDEVRYTKNGTLRVRPPWRSSLQRRLRGTALLFRSGKFNLVGLTSSGEAEEWRRKLCAVIRDCWISGNQDIRSVSTAASSSRGRSSATRRRQEDPAPSGSSAAAATATTAAEEELANRRRATHRMQKQRRREDRRTALMECSRAREHMSSGSVVTVVDLDEEDERERPAGHAPVAASATTTTTTTTTTATTATSVMTTPTTPAATRS